jgi:hypothetical protein
VMAFGQPIFHARPTPPAVLPLIDSRNAMAEVLVEYLRCVVFRTDGLDAPPTDFRLNAIERQWPDAGKGLDYPVASVIDATEVIHERRSPIPLEETLGQYDCMVGYSADPAFPKTVLWTTGEAWVDFQVDFWLSNDPDRQAIASRLPQLFSPGQERTGVLLGGHPKYYDRVVRATLMSTSPIDTEQSVYPNERRLKAVVRCNVDDVDLRIATLLTPVATVEATDPSDPGATP